MPDYGFPKKLRLNRAENYKAVFNQAKYKVSCRYLMMFAIDNELPQPRIGIIVGKKNVAKAVHRNRIKRVLRNTFRLNQDLLAGLDIVILARSGLGTLHSKIIVVETLTLFQDLARKKQNSAS